MLCTRFSVDVCQWSTSLAIETASKMGTLKVEITTKASQPGRGMAGITDSTVLTRDDMTYPVESHPSEQG